MWRNSSRPALVVAGVALVVLAGCGGGGQTASAGAAATTPTTSAPPTVATVPVSTTIAGTSTTAAGCPDMLFSSNPEDTATSIRTIGLSCADAAVFIKKVVPQVSSVNSPPRVESDGYVCLRTSLRSGDHGPPLGTIECASGATKVTFARALDV